MSSKSTLPILVAGAAAFLILGSKEGRRKSLSRNRSVYEPAAVLPGEKDSASTSTPLAKDLGNLNQLMIDLGYDGYTQSSVRAFQLDWNSMMEWLWENNPNITKSTPKYGPIGVDGKWGQETADRAARAIRNVPKGGINILIDEREIPVSSFRDMVRKSYEATREPVVSDGIEKLLFDLGYGGSTNSFVMTFQMDWNSLTEWLWKNDKLITHPTRYDVLYRMFLEKDDGVIGVDGKWGPETEKKAFRAIQYIPRNGSTITIDGLEIKVLNFKDMIYKIHGGKCSDRNRKELEEALQKGWIKKEDAEGYDYRNNCNWWNKSSNDEYPFIWRPMSGDSQIDVNIAYPDDYLINHLSPFLKNEYKEKRLILGDKLTGNEMVDSSIRIMMKESLDKALSKFSSQNYITIMRLDPSSEPKVYYGILISDIPEMSLNLWSDFLSLMRIRGFEFQMGAWPK